MSRSNSTKQGRQARADAEITIGKNKKVKIRFWVELKNETFLASGRVMLLERIDKYKSISEAAKSMNISYKHAYQLINKMNQLSSKPLIETSIGGEKGGGAKLTKMGKLVIKEFYEIKKRIQKIFEQGFE